MRSTIGNGETATPDVGTDKAVTTNIQLTGTHSGNYTLTQPTDITVNITAASLTITGVNATDRVYDTTDQVTLTGGALQGVIGSDTVTFTLGNGTTTPEVGTNKAVNTAITLDGTHSGNYTLTQPTDITVNITAASLTITGVTAETRVYDGTDQVTLTGGALQGVIGSDTVNFILGNGTTNANAGTNKAVTTDIQLTGTHSGNYTLTQPTNITVDITPATLTITGVTATTRVYNGTDQVTLAGGTLHGIIGSDTVNFALGNGTTATPDVGTNKAVTTNIQLTGTHSGNYTLTQPTGITVNITAATLTITGVAATNRVYNGTTAVTLTGGTLQGVISGDTVTFTLGNGTTSRDVGTNKAVTANIQLTGTHSGNYTLTQPTNITVNITAAPLTIAGVTATNRVYNGTTAVTLTGGTLQGVISGDTVTFTLGNGTTATADTGTNKAVTTTIALDGTHSGNYTLTQPTGITVNITAATPTVATVPTASSVIVGQTLQLSTLTGGVVNGVAGENNIAGTWTWQTPTEPMNTSGTHQRTAIFTPASGNYTTQTATVNVTVNNPININGAIINVTSTHEYNRAAHTPTFTVTHSGNTLTQGTHFTAAYTNNTNAGTATITLTGMGIYTATGTFTITAKPLTWATGGTVNNKTYNGNTTATVLTAPTLGGVISPDVVTVQTGTVNFASANAGTHAVTASGTWGITGANASNYTAPTTLPTFANGTITRATPTPTVTLDFFAVLSRVPLTAMVNGVLGENLTGTWAWTTPTTIITASGNSTHTATFTPTGASATNYNAATVNVTVNAQTGNGTAANPFRIYNETDLRAVGRGTAHNGGTWATNSHYRLMRNIPLTQGN